MDKTLEVFERAVMYTLIAVGMLFVLYETTYLIYQFGLTLKDSFKAGQFLDEQGKTLGVLFFNVLLTMEIVETVRVFKKSHKNKIQIILLVGLIAVTRKILMLDAMHATPIAEIATAVLLVALGVGYYLVSRSLKSHPEEKLQDECSTERNN